MAENRSRTSLDWRRTGVLAALAIVVALPSAASAQHGGDQSWTGYQRKGTFAGGGHEHGDWRRDGHGRFAPQAPVSAGWFQRPYPYHLDYYRMRYGGSYAPYFGNLYGPPNVVVAPPYYGGYGYGGYGPYSGGNGYPPGYPYPPSGPVGGYESGGAAVVAPVDADELPPSEP